MQRKMMQLQESKNVQWHNNKVLKSTKTWHHSLEMNSADITLTVEADDVLATQFSSSTGQCKQSHRWNWKEGFCYLLSFDFGIVCLDFGFINFQFHIRANTTIDSITSDYSRSHLCDCRICQFYQLKRSVNQDTWILYQTRMTNTCSKQVFEKGWRLYFVSQRRQMIYKVLQFLLQLTKHLYVHQLWIQSRSSASKVTPTQ